MVGLQHHICNFYFFSLIKSLKKTKHFLLGESCFGFWLFRADYTEDFDLLIFLLTPPTILAWLGGCQVDFRWQGKHTLQGYLGLFIHSFAVLLLLIDQQWRWPESLAYCKSSGSGQKLIWPSSVLFVRRHFDQKYTIFTSQFWRQFLEI